MELKRCCECLRKKPIDYFGRRCTRNAAGNYILSTCIDCMDQQSLGFFVPTNRKTDRWFYLNQYKLGRCVETRLKRYNKLFHSQGGRCAICKRWTHPKPLCVDHDHKTGKVRGLLCTRCNIKLGQWHDKPPANQTAFIKYLSQ